MRVKEVNLDFILQIHLIRIRMQFCPGTVKIAD